MEEIGEAALGDILAWRDALAAKQRAILANGPASALGRNHTALLCFTLNIPGPRKTVPLIRRCFDEGLRALHRALAAEHYPVLLVDDAPASVAGYAHFALLDAAPADVKRLSRHLEDTHPLGRLFDMDVLDAGGQKLSRGDGAGGVSGQARPCLICGGDAFACARSRAHPLADVEAAANRIMVQWLRGDTAGRAASLALRALLGELAVTPKPGLVDRNNNGAHQDMHFFTFIDSIAAILPFFRRCALYGFDNSDASPKELLSALRLDGKIAEAAMRDATGGVNTHQGAIFSLGLLSAAYGRLFRQTGAVSAAALCDLCAAMTESAVKQRGALSEAAAGFPTVRLYGLPVLQKALAVGHSKNDAGVAALLAMLAHAEDSNVTRRGGRGALNAIHADLQAFIASMPALPVTLEKAAALDREFIARNISPGGTADLLAVTFFFHSLP